MLPMVASIVANLLQNGMHKVADQVLEKGVEAVEKKLGIELKPESEATPEYNNKLQAEANRHAEFMAEMDLKNMEGARAMHQKALESEDPLVRRFVYFFIAFWSVLAAIYIGAITFVDIPQGNVRFADTIIGFVLGTMVASMFQFLLGSSLGSRSKDKK